MFGDGGRGKPLPHAHPNPSYDRDWTLNSGTVARLCTFCSGRYSLFQATALGGAPEHLESTCRTTGFARVAMSGPGFATCPEGFLLSWLVTTDHGCTAFAAFSRNRSKAPGSAPAAMTQQSLLSHPRHGLGACVTSVSQSRKLVLLTRFELVTSSLPRTCATSYATTACSLFSTRFYPCAAVFSSERCEKKMEAAPRFEPG